MDKKESLNDFEELEEYDYNHLDELAGTDDYGFDINGIHIETGTEYDLNGYTQKDYEEMEEGRWEAIAEQSRQFEAEMEAEADARYLEELKNEGIELKDEVARLKNKLAQAERLLAQYNKSKNRENEKDINGLDIGE